MQGKVSLHQLGLTVGILPMIEFRDDSGVEISFQFPRSVLFVVTLQSNEAHALARFHYFCSRREDLCPPAS